MKNRNAFTLIELLVVVAVITLLIAILIPSLSRAREQGRKTVCLAHLKQIGNAFYAYAGNNDGMVPDGYTNLHFQWTPTTGVTLTGAQIQGWNEELYAEGVVAEKIKITGAGVSTGQFFATGWGIFNCPSALFNNPPSMQAKPEGTGGNVNAGYGMAYYAGSIWYNTVSAVTYPLPNGTAFIPNTMRVNDWIPGHIVVVESSVGINTSGELPIGQTPDPVYGAKYGVWLRHNRGSNYLFGDAHAEWSNLYHTYDPAQPTLNREYDAGGTGSPPHAKESSIWGHNPKGIKGGWGDTNGRN